MRDLGAQGMKVLELVANGKQNKEIAREMDLSIHTVRTHRHRILKYFGTSNMTHAIALAVSLKMIQLSVVTA
jgi:two-component system nitrate/nitrite response regulator NarL